MQASLEGLQRLASLVHTSGKTAGAAFLDAFMALRNGHIVLTYPIRLRTAVRTALMTLEWRAEFARTAALEPV